MEAGELIVAGSKATKVGKCGERRERGDTVVRNIEVAEV